jgi:predicted phosphohydrolase
MKIQILSDIHLEFCKKIPLIPITGDILCLAGDIGNPFNKLYEEFLKYVNSKFNKVFIITGNHEYYNNTIYDANNKICSIVENLNNVVFLNNTTYEYNNYLFVGCTLWTSIKNTDYYEIISSYNDFTKIENMTFKLYNELHIKDKNFIIETINNNLHQNIIILTHHLPSYKLIDEKYLIYGSLNSCFASNNDDLIKEPIKLWIYGHTHTANQSCINDIPLICNPFGYPNENKKVDLNKIFIL